MTTGTFSSPTRDKPWIFTKDMPQRGRKIHPKGDHKGLHSFPYFSFTFSPCIFHTSGRDDHHFEQTQAAENVAAGAFSSPARGKPWFAVFVMDALIYMNTNLKRKDDISQGSPPAGESWPKAREGRV